MSDLQDQIKKLQAENLRLKTELQVLKTQNKAKKGLQKYMRKTSVNALVGRGLKGSVLRLLQELPGPIQKDTIADVSSHLIWRLTRIGTFAILVATVPLLVMAMQTYILSIQNDKLDFQNQLIGNQNHRLDQQIHLDEGMRRSSFVFLMSNIMDKVDEELKEPTNTDRQLSDELIGRIVSLTQALRPYRYLENDNLTRNILSPERGQLLFSLTNSLLHIDTYEKIYARANFSFADLREANFSGSFLRKANLAYSYFSNADFTNANLEGADLTGAYLENALFENTYMPGVLLNEAHLRESDFINVVMHHANLTRADLREIFLNGDFSNTNLEGIRIHDAEIDFVLLDDAYFYSSAWMDSLDDLRLKGLFSIRENYEVENRVIISESREVPDTFFILRPTPNSKTMLMNECEKMVMKILESAPRIRRFQNRLKRSGQSLEFLSVANPFGSEDLQIQQDSIYSFLLVTDQNGSMSSQMWLRFDPAKLELVEIMSDLGEIVPLTFDKTLGKLLKLECRGIQNQIKQVEMDSVLLSE